MNLFIRFLENALYPFRAAWAYFGRGITLLLGKKSPFKLTLAGKIAFAYFFCFAIFITIIWVVSLFNDQSFRFNSITDMWFGSEVTIVDYILYYLIALLISVAVYWGVRLATREKPSLYPEIDQCWAPIEKWREKQNIDWHEFKRYLVLGSDMAVSKAMHAEMKDRKIGALPTGTNEWMHWFGTNESLYLHLKNVCNTSERVQKVSGKKRGPSIDPTNTLQASVGVPDWSASIGIDDVTAEVDGSFGASGGAFGGSLDAAQSLDPYDSASFESPEESEDNAADTDGEEEELGEDGDTPQDRIRYLCKLIQAKTEGQIPFNGVLVVIPFDKFMTRENYKTITAAVKKDLLEIRAQTDLSFPVSFVFCSMEKDQGFPKLQNLLGSQRSSTGRFGAGCRLTDIPTLDKKNLSIQVQRACRSFEDWVINRWGKPSQLSRAAQNKELYKMIVRVRQTFRPNLTHLMENALLWNNSESPTGGPTDLTLAGCYFVSTGEHSSDRGFLNGLFLKCEEFAETSSWGEAIINRDRTLSVFSTVLFLLSLLVIVAISIFLWNQTS
ncbi:MAG: type VI secretion protein IcmF/TssM N-terminal domain-containing protein [Mariniblastus sp.]